MSEVNIGEKTYVYVELEELASLKRRAEAYDLIQLRKKAAKLEESDHTRWIELMRAGNRVEAVKTIRALCGAGLTEAVSIMRTYEETGKICIPGA